ncbi:unnamed protein product [Rotaria sordida]|uniref:AAA+ ATPase domain-containing protein n=1 Tax=Rotaria sordida TaxID=392033 RepID=A0A819S5X0_9BILA|nr:unnamed protein product [Rotaria sordida]CAF4059004.1 unnamed protein product [Rotaria sordida]
MTSQFSFAECKYSENIPIHETNRPTTVVKELNVTTVLAPTLVPLEELTMTIRIKFKYLQLKEFVYELNKPNDTLIINGKSVSVFHLYALRSTSKPIDMSNQTERLIYRPNLFIRKNDKFGPWNFNYLLDLLELNYRPGTNGSHFPEIWYTTSNTSLNVTIIPYNESVNDGTEIINPSSSSEAINTLEDLLKSIGRQNKYDQRDIKKWKEELEVENIKTIEHLQNTVMNESVWDKLSGVRPTVKQMIYDYVQLNAIAGSFNQTTDPYKESPATLLGDIHRVKRYFYDAIGKKEQLTYLDRKAVDLAIDELRSFYADDGNVLSTIHEYLRTFCVPTASFTEEEIVKKRSIWLHELKQLEDEAVILTEEANLATATSKLENNQKEINDRKSKLELIDADEHRKLKVKIGRGLLLYGPPGTGKSELLKRAAVYAGITMTTVPLSAGELNRPYVGETERLLIDIMYRANTIPYLMCAMTIDEIDGLVPKRDNNAQQSKVDGISVLLSHIEGVKNIPNLIVFGATNRRNMMDDAFLRRMQAKCFVGRPSPEIRKKMLKPLLTKDLKDFTDEQLDFLVKITTNFSGAAIGALKSSIVSFLADNQTSLSNHTLLSLANNTAREFSCWFGSGTLPEICRIYPNIFDTNTKNNQSEQFSLVFPEKPSGRILIDLQERKCFIELSRGLTLEKPLLNDETSLMTLLARIINGCSSRNIDTIQIIDTDFLSKNNALDDNKILELLATTFAECDEYNRSMFIFDIDSLIMLSISDSNMPQSTSISNIHLYQYIREKCKQAFVEHKPVNCNNKFAAKEKWIVMIVKHSFLRSHLIEDIDFKKSQQQLQKEQEREEKERDDETEKICPKCRQSYILSKTNYGNCRYHDGYIYNLESKKPVSYDEAQAILQAAKLTQTRSSTGQHPKLIWVCCLGVYGSDPSCRAGICGLPQELQEKPIQNSDQIKVVEKYFRDKTNATEKIKAFENVYNNLSKSLDTQVQTTSSINTTFSNQHSTSTLSYK